MEENELNESEDSVQEVSWEELKNDLLQRVMSLTEKDSFMLITTDPVFDGGVHILNRTSVAMEVLFLTATVNKLYAMAPEFVPILGSYLPIAIADLYREIASFKNEDPETEIAIGTNLDQKIDIGCQCQVCCARRENQTKTIN